MQLEGTKLFIAGVFCAALTLTSAGCARRTSSSGSPSNGSPEAMRKAMLPTVTNWFVSHDSHFPMAYTDGDRLVVGLAGLDISPATDRLAKEFATAMGDTLLQNGFANDFVLEDLKTKSAKTYQLKSTG